MLKLYRKSRVGTSSEASSQGCGDPAAVHSFVHCSCEHSQMWLERRRPSVAGGRVTNKGGTQSPRRASGLQMDKSAPCIEYDWNHNHRLAWKAMEGVEGVRIVRRLWGKVGAF